MKKVIVIMTLTFLTSSFSQMKVVDKSKEVKAELIGKLGSFGAVWIEIKKIDNEYFFNYQDVKYTKITNYKSFSFKDIDNAYDNFYKIIRDGLENPPKENVKIEFPNSIVELEFQKVMGVGNVRFYHSENGVTGYSVWLTKRKARKLFGKK